jgi:hypothetical protein
MRWYGQSRRPHHHYRSYDRGRYRAPPARHVAPPARAPAAPARRVR